MALFVLILGAILAAVGAGYLLIGFDIVMTERGAAMTIGGAVALAGGVVTVAVGCAVLRLTQVLRAIENRPVLPQSPVMPHTSVESGTDMPGTAVAAGAGVAAAGVAAVGVVAAGVAAAVAAPAEAVPTAASEPDMLPEPAVPEAAAPETVAVEPADPEPAAVVLATAQEDPLSDPLKIAIDQLLEEDFLSPSPRAPEFPGSAPEAVDLAEPVSVITPREEVDDDAAGEAADAVEPDDPGPMLLSINDPLTDGISQPPGVSAHDATADDHLLTQLVGEVSMAAPASPAPGQPSILGNYRAGGRVYTMYSDGTVQADTEHGVERFESMQALREHLART